MHKPMWLEQPQLLINFYKNFILPEVWDLTSRNFEV